MQERIFQKICESCLKANPIEIEPSKGVFAVGIFIFSDCLQVLADDRPVYYPFRRENKRL